MLFVQVILPVFLIISSGWILEKKGKLDFRTLTVINLYLLTPALVFSSLMKRDFRLALAGELFLFMVLYTAALLAISSLFGRGLKLDLQARGALALTTVMPNIGNFGLPLAWFAFGAEGVEASILTFVLFNIPLGTLAIVLAQGSGASLREAFINIVKIPVFHGVVLAFALKMSGVGLPRFLLDPIELVGQGAVPLMLVLLGMQLARTRLNGNYGFLSLSVTLRLLVSPLVATGIAVLLGLGGIERGVAVLQTSTPSAVLPLLYSMRFGTRPDLVAGAIFISTLLSAFSLTVLLYILQ